MLSTQKQFETVLEIADGLVKNGKAIVSESLLEVVDDLIRLTEPNGKYAALKYRELIPSTILNAIDRLRTSRGTGK